MASFEELVPVFERAGYLSSRTVLAACAAGVTSLAEADALVDRVSQVELPSDGPAADTLVAAIVAALWDASQYQLRSQGFDAIAGLLRKYSYAQLLFGQAQLTAGDLTRQTFASVPWLGVEVESRSWLRVLPSMTRPRSASVQDSFMRDLAVVGAHRGVPSMIAAVALGNHEYSPRGYVNIEAGMSYSNLLTVIAYGLGKLDTDQRALAGSWASTWTADPRTLATTARDVLAPAPPRTLHSPTRPAGPTSPRR